MYENQTYEKILQRLIDAVPSDVQKSEGSFIYDALAPAALELAQAYIQLDNIINLGFAPTTYGKYLDYRATEHGINRKSATKASGQVTISGTAGTIVPAGPHFATAGGITFVTATDVTIGESGAVSILVTAQDAGVKGNLPGGTINQIPVALTGVTAVTNPVPTSGGTDQENDSDLLNRLLTKVRDPATSGNVSHYQQWALEVAGVGDARVLPTENGPGTVKLILLDSNKQPASTQIVEAVTDHIEAVRPIGASVSVVSASGLSINVAATVTLTSGAVISQVQLACQTAMESYLRKIAFQQSYISYAQLGNLILDIPGVMDYTGLTLNDGTVNKTVENTQVAVIGTVNLHE